MLWVLVGFHEQGNLVLVSQGTQGNFPLPPGHLPCRPHPPPPRETCGESRLPRQSSHGLLSFLLSFLPCQEKSSFLPCQGNFPPSPGRLPRQSSQGLSSFLLSFLPCQEKSSFLPPFLPRLSFSLSLSAPSINILPPLSHPLGLLYGR